MENKIKFTKQKASENDTDLEWINEFFQFLQGDVPESLHIGKHKISKLTPKKAFSIIYYLQEHLPVFPDNIEICSNCKDLFYTNYGFYCEKRKKWFCAACY